MIIQLILADDHAVLLDGLCLLFKSQLDMQVIGTASNGREAVRLVAQKKPDVVVMDVAMPELNGIEATIHIRADFPETRVVILSEHSSPEVVSRSIQAGAHAFVCKESQGVEVIRAVRCAREGRSFLDSRIQQFSIAGFNGGGKHTNLLKDLSRREREVLQLVVEGKSSAEIARMIFLSPKTVETYRSRLMTKLNLSNVPQLVKFAIQHGMTSLE